MREVMNVPFLKRFGSTCIMKKNDDENEKFSFGLTPGREYVLDRKAIKK